VACGNLPAVAEGAVVPKSLLAACYIGAGRCTAMPHKRPSRHAQYDWVGGDAMNRTM